MIPITTKPGGGEAVRLGCLVMGYSLVHYSIHHRGIGVQNEHSRFGGT